MELPEAIYKATTLPASRLRLTDRGMIVPGYWADIVIFDPATIADRSTYQQPHQFPAGIEHVLVNGDHTIEKGKFSGKLNRMII